MWGNGGEEVWKIEGKLSWSEGKHKCEVHVWEDEKDPREDWWQTVLMSSAFSICIFNIEFMTCIN